MNGTGLCGLSPLFAVWPGPAGPAPPGAASRVGCDVRDNRPPTHRVERTNNSSTLGSSIKENKRDSYRGAGRPRPPSPPPPRCGAAVPRGATGQPSACAASGEAGGRSRPGARAGAG